MRKSLLFIFFLLLSSLDISAQYYYPEIVSYGGAATPINGLKIKTNLPYAHGSQMPAVYIQGYNYNKSETISITVVWYIYNGNFIHYGASSAGSYTPEIKLANENNKVVIYINDRQYYQRFFVSAFAKKNEAPSWFTGWTIADEPLNGTNVVTVPYRNRFSGDILLPNGIWNKDGNVGIGTANTRNDRLAVNGQIRAKEVKVEVSNWPDYVFEEDYELPSLSELESFIRVNGHLPDIPSKAEVEAGGISLGAVNTQLLKKIEELTLYLIEKDHVIKVLQQEVAELKNKVNE